MVYAVLGPSGTFSEEAANSYWSSDVKLEVVESIQKIFTRLINNEISDALIPLENSQAGTIETSIVCLQKYPVSIQGDLYMPIKQHLMGLEKYDLDEIELLVTQSAVYAQCDDYINKNFPHVRTEVTTSTAKAVQIVKSESRKAAAIANEKAANLYGLQIIEKNIQNDNNITRFIHVSNQKPKLIDADKASMIFSLADYPGSLSKVLQIFAEYNLNLTKIESRPSPLCMDSFSFYIDIDIKDKLAELNDVIVKLEKCCQSVKFFGAYNSTVNGNSKDN
ncbi:MAG: prephenate dehydratase [Syntrophomonadaceae bacterium]|nr:prephenate dehydratase [Syntrophomonadaceae bacterium]